MRRAEPPVRYNDSVMTLIGLAVNADGPSADAVFGNLFDLVAQNKAVARGPVRGDILISLQSLMLRVTPSARQRVARHITRLPVELPADLALLLQQMTTSSDRSWLAKAQLSQHAWAAVLPTLSLDEVRKVATRNDLPTAIALQLGGIKPMPLLLPAPAGWQAEPETMAPETADMILELTPATHIAANDFEPLPAIVAVTTEDSESDQVKNLLERIAWFRKRPVPAPEIAAETPQAEPLAMADAHDISEIVSAPSADSLFLLDNPLPTITPEPEAVIMADPVSDPAPDAPSLPALLADWFWETDRHGRFVFAAASSANATISADALRALTGQYLLDWLADSPQLAKAEKALQRRSNLHGLTLRLPDGAFAGHWSLSGVAAFESSSGTFLGHRGVAQLQPASAETDVGSVPDALAMAAHETRTPLNAIMGFAQMIQAQPFGPVSPAYTAQAEAILDASARLLRVLDDVSESARLDRGLAVTPDYGFSLEPVLEAAVAQLSSLAARRQVHFALRTEAGIPSLWSDKDVVERCISRLSVALLSVAVSGETIGISARDGARDHVLISFSRPAALQGVSTAEIMKPVRSDGPRLNIGFGLRLVERLAAAVGGHLFVGSASIDLMLPAVPALAPLLDAAAQ
jgi:signal transduction histidine kinase